MKPPQMNKIEMLALKNIGTEAKHPVPLVDYWLEECCSVLVPLGTPGCDLICKWGLRR